MDYVNEMHDRVLSALQSIVDGWKLEWVRIVGGPFQGTIRLLQSGQFQTLLKIEYEFQPERFRLLIYRDGKHISGRCNIDYDDGGVIDQIMTQFKRLRPDTHQKPAPVDVLGSCVDLPQSDYPPTLTWRTTACAS